MTKEKQKECTHCGAYTYLNNTSPCMRCGSTNFNTVMVEQSHYYDTTCHEDEW